MNSNNVVFFSSLIKQQEKYKLFWERLERILLNNEIEYIFIENTRDIWCRDYMPVQIDINEFVQFRYLPDYLLQYDFIHLLTIQDEIKYELDIKVTKSKLIIDGGNVIKYKSKAVLTDKVYKDNRNLFPETVIKTLKKDLKCDDIFIIQKQPFDTYGHADGMVRFIDENTLLVSDYSKESTTWKSKYEKALDNTGLTIVTFPSAYTDERNEHGDYTAKGCYINFVKVGDNILFPQFGFDEDEDAFRMAEKLFKNCKVIGIDSNTIAYLGGVLNCMTWNVVL